MPHTETPLAALNHHIEKDGFRLRGLHMSRVDGFSDVVFGFALTLLVVSLEVPKTYAELHETLRGFLPFAISFVILLMIWFAHFKFFRRFGLHDTATIVLNAALLFVVLFYVYPLKFLFTFVTAWLLNGNNNFFQSPGEVADLMVLYGVGFATIYLLFAALYWNALRQRKDLDLSPVEEILVRGYILDVVGIAAIGILSCLLAKLLPVNMAGLSGWAYMLISLANALSGRYTRGKVLKLNKQIESPPAEPAPANPVSP